MDETIEMAVMLARKGQSDETIRMVVDAMRGHAAPSTAQAPTITRDASPPEERAIVPGRSKRARWEPLLRAMRAWVAAHGTHESDIRALAERCPAELAALAARVRPDGRSTLRGLGYLIGLAARRGEVLCGLRFTLLRHGPPMLRSSKGGSAYAIYRFEAV